MLLSRLTASHSLPGREQHVLRWRKLQGPEQSCTGTNLSIHTLLFFAEPSDCANICHNSLQPFLKLDHFLFLVLPHFPSGFPSLAMGTALRRSGAPPHLSLLAPLRAPHSMSTKSARTVLGAGRGDSYSTVSVSKKRVGEETEGVVMGQERTTLPCCECYSRGLYRQLLNF